MGGRGKKPTHRPRNQVSTARWRQRRGAARRGATGTPVAEMETAEGAGDAVHPPAHSTDAAAATTESDMHPRREYGKEETAALVGGQDRAGPAPEEGVHGDSRHRRTQQEEGGTKTPGERARKGQRPTDRRRRAPPPERSRAPNASGRRGGEGRGGTPTQQRAPMARSEGAGGDPREHQQGTPPARGAP